MCIHSDMVTTAKLMDRSISSQLFIFLVVEAPESTSKSPVFIAVLVTSPPVER